MRVAFALALTVIGAMLVVAGAAAVYWPAGVILAGIALIWAGMFGMEVKKTR